MLLVLRLSLSAVRAARLVVGVMIGGAIGSVLGLDQGVLQLVLVNVDGDWLGVWGWLASLVVSWDLLQKLRLKLLLVSDSLAVGGSLWGSVCLSDRSLNRAWGSVRDSWRWCWSDDVLDWCWERLLDLLDGWDSWELLLNLLNRWNSWKSLLHLLSGWSSTHDLLLGHGSVTSGNTTDRSNGTSNGASNLLDGWSSISRDGCLWNLGQELILNHVLLNDWDLLGRCFGWEVCNSLGLLDNLWDDNGLGLRLLQVLLEWDLTGELSSSALWSSRLNEWLSIVSTSRLAHWEGGLWNQVLSDWGDVKDASASVLALHLRSDDGREERCSANHGIWLVVRGLVELDVGVDGLSLNWCWNWNAWSKGDWVSGTGSGREWVNADVLLLLVAEDLGGLQLLLIVNVLLRQGVLVWCWELLPWCDGDWVLWPQLSEWLWSDWVFDTRRRWLALLGQIGGLQFLVIVDSGLDGVESEVGGWWHNVGLVWNDRVAWARGGWQWVDRESLLLLLLLWDCGVRLLCGILVLSIVLSASGLRWEIVLLLLVGSLESWSLWESTWKVTIVLAVLWDLARQLGSGGLWSDAGHDGGCEGSRVDAVWRENVVQVARIVVFLWCGVIGNPIAVDDKL